MRPDPYVIRARIIPALLAGAPLLLLAGLVAPQHLLAGAGTGAVGLATTALIAELVRDRGKRLEPRLWSAWGGPPTTQRLRHRNTQDPEAIQLLHRDLQRLTGHTLPTVQQELADPAAADRVYARATKKIIELTRHDTLVLEENTNYGMRRNLLGLRPLGLAIATTTAILSSIGFALIDADITTRATSTGIPLITSLIAGAGWTALTPDWIKPAADRYAERLLAAAATLPARTEPQPADPRQAAHT